MTPKILVTGYIGSHTVVELQLAGYEVIIVDNLSKLDARVYVAIHQITSIWADPKFANSELG